MDINIPIWLNEFIYLEVNSIHQSYLIELSYNPDIINRIKYIHEQMDKTAKAIVNEWQQGNIDLTYIQSIYPHIYNMSGHKKFSGKVY